MMMALMPVQDPYIDRDKSDIDRAKSHIDRDKLDIDRDKSDIDRDKSWFQLKTERC